MNILLTTQFGGVAGSTYSLFYLARGLKDKGHKVIIGLPYHTLLHRMCEEHSLPTVHIPFSTKFDLKSIRLIRDTVKKERIQLINAQESKDRYNAIFCKIFFTPFVKIVLTRRQRVADNNPVKRWLHVKFSEKIVVISEGLRKIVVRKGFPPEHLQVIYNGLPTEQYTLRKTLVEHLRKKFKITNSDKVIGCVARPKMQDQLVEALKKLPETYKLLIVGLDKEKYSAKFPESDLNAITSRIIFAGVVDDKEELFHHYSLMDVHVLPSKMDGFGLVSVEAMAMGVPVIGSNYGGIPDVIKHNHSGFIFENGDIEGLAKYIEKICTDHLVRKRFIKAGFETALNKFSISETINQYEKLFDSIIKQY